jgi:hypothetical protein
VPLLVLGLGSPLCTALLVPITLVLSCPGPTAID